MARKRKSKQDYLAVVSQRNEEVQSKFESDLFAVRYKIGSAVVLTYFTPKGIYHQVDDAQSKKGQYNFVIRPSEGCSYPEIHIQVERSDKD